MATREQIAKAVDNEEWQKFRLRMRGKPTWVKLEMLEDYHFKYVDDSEVSDDIIDDVNIRVDNYIKALARGGQLYAGSSLQYAMELGGITKLPVRK